MEHENMNEETILLCMYKNIILLTMTIVDRAKDYGMQHFENIEYWVYLHSTWVVGQGILNPIFKFLKEYYIFKPVSYLQKYSVLFWNVFNNFYSTLWLLKLSVD